MPCATNRLMAGTIVVPAFWRVEWCHAGPDRTSRSGAIPENAWTHILTDRQTRPANYFSPTHQWKSSFIERSMLKHLNVHSLRFWTRGRHCLIALPWAKIVDIPFWQFQHWTLFHDKGAFPVRTCAPARCTPPPCVIHH